MHDGQVRRSHGTFAKRADASAIGPVAIMLTDGSFDALGLVSHWDLESNTFDPVCYSFPMPAVSQSISVHFRLTSLRAADVLVGGVLQPVVRNPVSSGVLVLNQQAEGRESAIAALFWKDVVRERLATWEASCRRASANPDDAEWYCGKRHQYRTHVLAAAVLEPEHVAALPQPSEVAQITRPVADRGDRSRAANFSRHGFAGPYAVANASLVERLQEWYRKSRTQHAFPGDSISSQGYFGVASLIRSDVWILVVPDHLRLPLVAACQTTIAEWAGLMPEELEPMFAGHHARIYRRHASCPMHVDRRPENVETLSCVYHLGSWHGLSAGYPEWPMHFESHAGHIVQLSFRGPGELLVYEASVVPHGRPTDLAVSEEYVNVFIHFIPRRSEHLFHRQRRARERGVPQGGPSPSRLPRHTRTPSRAPTSTRLD